MLLGLQNKHTNEQQDQYTPLGLGAQSHRPSEQYRSWDTFAINALIE